MNKRRWVAIGIAVVLLIFSAISSSISRSSESKKELSQVNELLYGNNEPQEETVEEGSDTEKLLN